MIKSISRRNNKIKEFITRDTTINKCRISGEKYKNTFTRNRKISCKDLLLMTLNKQGKSTSFEVRDFVLIKKGESKVEYSDEAYLKQRRKLNPDVFKEMNKIYLNDFYTEEKYVEKEKGYIICAIDGSKDEIPNTIKNRKEFGYAENQ